MDLLQICAHLNNEGAALLATNSSLPAFERFRSALQILVLCIPEGNGIVKSCPALTKVCKSLLLEPRSYHWVLWPTEMLPNARVSAELDAQQNDTRIFSKAFVFQPEDDQQRAFDLRIRTYVALVLFNLAATIHRTSAAMPRNQKRDHGLNVALELYDVGFDMLLQEESCCIDDWATNISLATLNNTAEVHRTLADFARASRVLELQKGLLEIMISNKRPHNFSDQEMEIFFMNTLLLQAPSAAAAA